MCPVDWMGKPPKCVTRVDNYSTASPDETYLARETSGASAMGE